jgi:hypothetical protein
MNEKDILSENLYLKVTNASIETLSKCENGIIKHTVIPNEYFDPLDLQQIQEAKSISTHHQAIILWAMIKAMHKLIKMH